MSIRSTSLLLTAFALFSCAEKKSGNGSTASEKDDGEIIEDVAPPDEAETGKLEITTATQVIDLTVNALNSAGSKESFGSLSATSFSPGTVAVVTGESLNGENGQMTLTEEEAGPRADNPNCNGNGSPYDDKGKRIDLGNELYAIKKLYCLLNDKDSPDVVLGAIGIVKGFICLAEKQSGFSYSESGTKVEASFSDIFADAVAVSCFPKEVIEAGKKENGPMKWTATITGSLLKEGPWSHKLEINEHNDNPDDEEDSVTYFTVKDKKAAFKRGGISASLDFEKGILRFENLETKHSRHSRFFIKGELNIDGTFKSQSEFNAAHNDYGYSSVISGAGSAAGYVYQQYLLESKSGDWKHGGTACLAYKTACTKDLGIRFTTEADKAFLGIDDDDKKAAIAAWAGSHGPLCYEKFTTTLIPDGNCAF